MEIQFGKKFFDFVVLQTYGLDKETSKAIIYRFQKSLAEFQKSCKEMIQQQIQNIQELKATENLKYEESASYFVKEFNRLWADL